MRFLDPCPICRSDDVVTHGALDAFFLYECRHCSHRWQTPTAYDPVEEALSISDRHQSTPPEWVRNILDQEVEPDRSISVLDVGCWQGDILAGLPSHWNKVGIEINQGAAEAAKNKGIEVINQPIERIELPAGVFDVILMLDILEHLEKPVESLTRLGHCLKQGGVMVALTGAADSLVSRLARQNWYYCRYREHIGFFSEASAREAFRRAALRPEFVRLAHPAYSFFGTIGKALRRASRSSTANDFLDLGSTTLLQRVSILATRVLPCNDHFLIRAYRN